MISKYLSDFLDDSYLNQANNQDLPAKLELNKMALVLRLDAETFHQIYMVVMTLFWMYFIGCWFSLILDNIKSRFQSKRLQRRKSRFVSCVFLGDHSKSQGFCPS